MEVSVIRIFLLVLALGATTAAEAAMSAGATAAPAQDPVLMAYRQRQADATPESVFAWLKAGNAKFASGQSDHGGYVVDARERIQVSGKGQRPLAVVLSCLDSRTTPELVFDMSVGDLFTTRVGANVISDDVLGGMEVAIDSGAKVIVVMGHTNCGGVGAACNNAELEHFTQLLAKIKPAIQEVNTRLDADPAYATEVGERVCTNRRYIKELSHANAQQSYRQILAQSKFIKEKVDKGEVKLVSALYDVDSGKVMFDQN